MQAQRYGRIVLLGTSALYGAPPAGWTAYVTAKSAQLALARMWAAELGPFGITVNTVAPGGVSTPMMLDELTEEQVDSFVDMIPLRRLAEPDELSGAVLFLASEHARYITGATVNVSGGQLMY